MHKFIPKAPLKGFLKSCETFCDAYCCGLDAFNFSQFCIAASIHTKASDWITSLKDQITELKLLEGEENHIVCEIDFTGYFHKFTKKELTDFTSMLLNNIEVAIKLVSKDIGTENCQPNKIRFDQEHEYIMYQFTSDQTYCWAKVGYKSKESVSLYGPFKDAPIRTEIEDTEFLTKIISNLELRFSKVKRAKMDRFMNIPN